MKLTLHQGNEGSPKELADRDYESATVVGERRMRMGTMMVQCPVIIMQSTE